MSNVRQQPSNATNVYGPYEMASRIGPDGLVVATIPWKDIHDSTIIMSIESNSVQVIAFGAQPSRFYGIINVETSIIGSVQGYQALLKRMTLNPLWGPNIYRLGNDEIYDQIIFKGRLFIGGKPGIPNDIVLSAPLSVKLTINIQPRNQ